MKLGMGRSIILSGVLASSSLSWACAAFDPHIATEKEVISSQNSSSNTTDVRDRANTHSTSAISSFEGEIGHYEASQSFSDFIFEYQNQVVFINAYYLPEFEDEIKIENDNFGVDYFHLWHHCSDSLEPNEVPSYRNCTGTGFSLVRGSSPKDADFTYIRDTLRIQGYFAIRGCDGPHQGSMGCTLRPLNPEDL